MMLFVAERQLNLAQPFKAGISAAKMNFVALATIEMPTALE